ncbi:12905_t:CDS:2, partial [Funneliformis caledonium]
ENKNDINQPDYTCQCDSDSSEIEDNPTNAITSLYRKIFKTQTKISGSMVIGFDKESIFSELLHNIEFCPYSISLADKLSIMIFSLGTSKKEGNSSANIWQKVEILGKYQGTQLFELEHTYTQSVLQRLYIPKCQPSQWDDKELINNLYEYYFKR